MDFWPWNELGIEAPPRSVRDVKKAYARKLKSIDPESQPEAFQGLREAYEYARHNWEEDFLDEEDFEEQEDEPVEVSSATTAQFASLQSDAQQDDLRVHGEAGDVAPGDERGSSLEAAQVRAQALPVSAAAIWKVFNDEERSLVDRWSEVFGSPELRDPLVRLEVEHAVFDYVRDRFEQDGESLSLASEISSDVVALIDKHFEWTSDYPGFNRKFPFSDGILFGLQRVKSPSSFELHGPSFWVKMKNRFGLPVAALLLFLGISAVLVAIFFACKHLIPLVNNWGKILVRGAGTMFIYLIVGYLRGRNKNEDT